MGLPTGFRLTESGIGDLRIEGKALIATLGEDERVHASARIRLGLSLPTGQGRRPRPTWATRPSPAGSRRSAPCDFGKVRAAANLGILLRETSQSFETEVGSPAALRRRRGLRGRRDRVELMLEVFGRSGLNQFTQFYSDVNPFEVDIAARYAHQRHVVGDRRRRPRLRQRHRRAASLRLFAVAAFAPDFRDRDQRRRLRRRRQVPRRARGSRRLPGRGRLPRSGQRRRRHPRRAGQVPERGRGRRSVRGRGRLPRARQRQGRHPRRRRRLPERRRGRKRQPGRRTAARRRPRTATATASPTRSTSAPTSPRTSDGFQDEDGCPDPDNDNDGILDDVDNCPNDAEDKDGFEDEDGCPDPDNDKDGILDADDKCPTSPRRSTASRTTTAAPIRAPRSCASAEERIELDERIGFVSRGGKLQLKDSSAKFVNLVALIMKGHPEIAKVRIEVHAEGVSAGRDAAARRRRARLPRRQGRRRRRA